MRRENTFDFMGQEEEEKHTLRPFYTNLLKIV